MRLGMSERRRDAAERAEAGAGEVGQALPPFPGPAAERQRIDMAAQRIGGVVDQRLAVEQRLRLVAAEAARPAAGDDRAEDQPAFSSLTGTDLPAGTRLSSAWWATGIRSLHSG